MTTPGATEAVTPEQLERVRDIGRRVRKHLFIARSGGIGPLEPGLSWEANDIIAKALLEAEANALRRCHDMADQKAQACTALADACVIGAAGPYSKPDRTILDKRWHAAQAAAFGETAHAIRSLLPKEEGK